VNLFVANLRRTTVLLAAVALLSSLGPAPARAQTGGSTPAPAPPADSTVVSGKNAKKSKAQRPPKPPRLKKGKAHVEASGSDSTATASGSHAKSQKPPRVKKARTPKVHAAAASDSTQVAKKVKAPKAPKVAKTREPEKSWEEQKKEDGPYAKSSNWLAFRFGYAKRSGDLAGDGFVGYGVAYQHMMSRKWAFAAGVGHDIVGHFGTQLDEAVPFTAEFERHYKWNTALRPYIGVGGGFYLRKMYRTGTDYNTTTTGGPHVSLGFTSALDEKHVIGVEARVASLKGRKGIVNPTFGPGQDTETIWTAKVTWALVY